MLLLKLSYLGGLGSLNSAKYSLIVVFQIQMNNHLTAGEQENICQFISGLDITIKIHFTVIIRNQIKHRAVPPRKV